MKLNLAKLTKNTIKKINKFELKSQEFSWFTLGFILPKDQATEYHRISSLKSPKNWPELDYTGCLLPLLQLLSPLLLPCHWCLLLLWQWSDSWMVELGCLVQTEQRKEEADGDRSRKERNRWWPWKRKERKDGVGKMVLVKKKKAGARHKKR